MKKTEPTVDRPSSSVPVRDVPLASYLEVQWSLYIAGNLPNYPASYADPVVADVDADGSLEVIVSSGGNGESVYCLDADDGTMEWERHLGWTTSYLAVADVDYDEGYEVIVGGGRLFCLNGSTGETEWMYGSNTAASPCIANLDGQPGLEVVIAASNTVECVNSSGDMVWTTPNIAAYWYRSSPSAADLDSDGELEVAVGTQNGTVYSLNGLTGDIEWKHSSSASGTEEVSCATSVADINQDGVPEVIFGTAGGLVQNINGSDGSLNWNYTLPGYEFGGRPAITDVDLDGVMEVVVTASDDAVHCINGLTGTRDWRSSTFDFPRGSVSIADIDGDRELEVLVGEDGTALHCLNAEDGLREWYYSTWNNLIYATPLVADIDDDQRVELIITIGHTLNCFNYAGSAPEDLYYPWPGITPGGDMRGTGCFVDSDRDNLTDIFEFTAGTSAYANDSDSDTASDFLEFLACTDPTDGLWIYPTVEWVRNTEDLATFAGPTVADVDGEEGLEVIMGYFGNSYCLSGADGSTLWNFTPSAEHIMMESSVADINLDGQMEVLFGTGVFATSLGGVYCVNGTDGEKLWNFTTPGWVYGAPTVVDLEGDGEVEVLFGSGEDSRLYCLHGRNGTEIWNYTAPSAIFTSPAVGDVNGDGNLEIVFGCQDYKLYCLDALSGTQLWNYTTGERITFSDPCIFDMNQDGFSDVLQGSYDGYLHCVHGVNGSMMWKAFLGDWITGSALVADVDNDREIEVVIGSLNNKLQCLNSTGGLEWDFNTPDDIQGTASFTDIDGDHEGEVLFVSDSGYVYCLSGLGEEEWNLPVGFTQYRGSVPIADVYSDGQLEAVAASYASNKGKIVCMRVGSAPFEADAYPWPAFESFADPTHTNYYSDQDGDGLTDNYELAAGSPLDEIDVDTDGLTDLEEFYGGTDPRHDNIAPGVIADLSVTATAPASASLTWTAPGDNEYSGTATGYDVRYSTSGPIEDKAAWNAATVYPQSWIPLGHNETEIRTLTGLPSPSNIWFAVRALDEQDNLGGLSNSPGIQTLEFFPPSTISDLAALNATTSSLMLTWTAPGDDGMSGTADGYILKHSVAGPITTENWGSATTYSQSWNPGSPGSSEVREITGLLNATRYWFAIRAYDDVGNYGGVSNSPNLETLEGVRPGAPTDLVVASVTQTTVTLSWTAPGDNGTVGTAAGYIIKYSTSGQITSENWMDATEYMQDWTPLEAGETESHTLSDLAPDTTYWFAIMAYDDIPNYGELSESVLETTLEAVPPAMIGDLIVVDMNSSSITLNWTAPGDNGMSGRAAGYVVKYSVIGPITSENWESATTYDQSWDPHSAGHMENHAVLGLEEGANYWFAIVAYDEVGNYGEVSNTALGTTTIAGGFPAGFGSGLAIGVVAGAGSLAAVIVVVWLIRKKRGT
jgi:outer membrane protein assembly factor BamB